MLRFRRLNLLGRAENPGLNGGYMNTLLLVALIILFIAVIFLVVLLLRSKNKPVPQDNQSLLMLQNQIGQMTEQVNQQLGQMSQQMAGQMNMVTSQVNTRLKENMEVLQSTNKNIGDRLDNTANIVGTIQKTLGQLGETNKRIFEVGKDISTLQELLRAPTFRGEIGEFLLGNLLGQILPPQHFILKYQFKNGEIVDAVIKIADKLVPVDSKFPLENFKKMIGLEENEAQKIRRDFVRDVKKHIDAIARKYILADEGTSDFALLYIPAENVYYETIIKTEGTDEEKGLSSYALSKRIIPVSPNSFYAYLQVIMLGFKGFNVEKRTQEIVANLGRLLVDLGKFREDFEVLGKHISNTKTKYEDAGRHLDKFTDKLTTSSEIKALPDSKQNILP
jgi:DNA recombination protein RmuC